MKFNGGEGVKKREGTNREQEKEWLNRSKGSNQIRHICWSGLKKNKQKNQTKKQNTSETNIMRHATFSPSFKILACEFPL